MTLERLIIYRPLPNHVGITATESAAELKPSPIGAGPSDGSHCELRHQALHGVFWSAVCVWGNRALTLVFFAILARLLGPAAFGLIALSSVYVGFLMIIQDQGFGHAVIQREQLHPDHLNTAFWMNVGLALVLTVVTLLMAPAIGWVFHEPRISGVVRALSPLLLLGSLTSVQRALCFRAFRFRSLAVASIAGVTAGGAVGVLAALRGAGVWSLVLHQLTVRVCESCIIWWLSDWRPQLRFRREHLGDMFGFGKYVVGGQLAAFVHLYAADMVIGVVLGPTAVGLFHVAYRCIRMILQMIGEVVSRVSLPMFARLQQDPESGRAALLRATNQVALLSFPVFTAVAVLAPEIVSVAFGDKWVMAIPAVRILSLAGIAQSVYYLKRYLVLSYGRPKWHFGLELWTVVLTLAGVLLAVHAGLVAVAWAVVLAQLASFPLLFLAVTKLVHMRLTEDLRTLLSALTASIMAAIAVSLIKMTVAGRVAPPTVLAVGVLAGAGIYLAGVWTVDRASFLRSAGYVQTMLGRRGRGETPMEADARRPQRVGSNTSEVMPQESMYRDF